MKLGLLLVTAVFLLGPCALAQDSGIDSDIQILRSDIRADKTRLVSENMNLSDSEAKAFWPVYRDYENDLGKLNDQKIALLKEYAESYNNLSDEQAKSLTDRSLELEKKRVSLREEYFSKFSKVVAPKTAARFMQVDSRIDLLLNVKLASAVPMVEK